MRERKSVEELLCEQLEKLCELNKKLVRDEFESEIMPVKEKVELIEIIGQLIVGIANLLR